MKNKYDQKVHKNIIKKFKSGDKEAFREVFKQFYSQVYYFSLRIVKSEYLAEEISQDVFIRLWSYRATVDPEKSLQAFIFNMAKNQSIKFLKKADRYNQLKSEIAKHLHEPTASVDDQYIEKEYQIIASRAINNLPEQRKKIFKMSREEGLSLEEIAENLSISKNTVKVQMNRALNSIRDYLNTHANISFIFILYVALIFLLF